MDFSHKRHDFGWKVARPLPTYNDTAQTKGNIQLCSKRNSKERA